VFYYPNEGYASTAFPLRVIQLIDYFIQEVIITQIKALCKSNGIEYKESKGDEE